MAGEAIDCLAAAGCKWLSNTDQLESRWRPGPVSVIRLLAPSTPARSVGAERGRSGSDGAQAVTRAAPPDVCRSRFGNRHPPLPHKAPGRETKTQQLPVAHQTQARVRGNPPPRKLPETRLIPCHSCLALCRASVLTKLLAFCLRSGAAQPTGRQLLSP
jgi:hypothetical protein